MDSCSDPAGNGLGTFLNKSRRCSGAVPCPAGLAHQRLGIRAKQQLGIRRINLGGGERKTHFKLSSSFLKIFIALKFIFDGVLTSLTSFLLSSLPVATG